MRILAKLTSRRLTFAQQQQPDFLESNWEKQQNYLQPQFNSQFQSQQQHQRTSSLWFNVSQNQFIETEQRIIETEGNVLAFRFLLDRFANKQVPDTRFQVVLTAFQTLSENSDLNGAAQSSFGRPSVEPNAQFICDQQRLISANLACDGFKNCQDGQDEEPTTCLTLRPTQQYPSDFGTGSHGGSHDLLPMLPPPPPPPIRDQTSAGGNSLDQQLEPAIGGESRDSSNGILVRVWQYVRDTHSLAGFFLGFLLVLALLTCCSCCTYLTYLLLYRNHWVRNQRERRNQELAGEQEEADHLASAQNTENIARLVAGFAPPASVGLPSAGKTTSIHQQQQQQQPPPRLQSILKRPAEPPPAIPERPNRSQQTTTTSSSGADGGSGAKRGALQSSISRGQIRGGPQFRPTPAKRLTRPTRPVPLVLKDEDDDDNRSREQTTRSPGPSWRHPQAQVGTTSSQVAQPVASSSLGSRAPSSGAFSAPTTTTGGQTITNTTTSVTGTQRITTYHYSSGSTRLSESYLQKLAVEQRQQQPSTSATATPPGDPNVNYRRSSSVSPQSSLI